MVNKKSSKKISPTLKIIYIAILIIVVLFAVYFLMSVTEITGMATSGGCIDNDNTIFPLVNMNEDSSYFISSSVLYRGRTRKDYCTSNKKYIRERYCKNGRLRTRAKQKCEYGCENRACVSKNMKTDIQNPGLFHKADTDKDWQISNSELLRVIQFFNSNGYHCEPGTEDGFDPGEGDDSCYFHSADTDGDWEISLSELLRVMQLFNSNGYHVDPTFNSEDSYLPGEFQGYPNCNSNNLNFEQERLWNGFRERRLSQEEKDLLGGQYSWMDVTNLNKCDKVLLEKDIKGWEFILRI